MYNALDTIDSTIEEYMHERTGLKAVSFNADSPKLEQHASQYQTDLIFFDYTEKIDMEKKKKELYKEFTSIVDKIIGPSARNRSCLCRTRTYVDVSNEIGIKPATLRLRIIKSVLRNTTKKDLMRLASIHNELQVVRNTQRYHA